MTRLSRPFCSIFFIAVSISLCGLTVGIFLGNHISDKLIESRDTEIKFRSADWDGLLRTSSIHSQSSGVDGLLAIPKPIQTRNPIDHTEGTLHSKLRLNQVVCTYVKFNGTFDGVPAILVESTSKNIRVTVDEQSSNGFQICVIPTSYNLNNKLVEINWMASQTMIVVCNEKTEYKCQSGECIQRNTICDAEMNCLSGDDESSTVCYPAVSSLLLATFLTTAMITYLISYMIYIKEVRFVLNRDIEDEEIRLEEINQRESQRENHS